MERVLFVLNNMNIGGTEKAFLNLVDTLSDKQYSITLLLLERSGGYLELIPNNVDVIIMDEYSRIKPEIMEPPLLIIKKYFKQRKLTTAFKLAVAHVWFKITGNRTLYYEMVLNKYKLGLEFDKAIAYCGPFDFITVLVLKCIKAKEKIQWIHFDVNKFQFNINTCRHLYTKFSKIYVVSDEARKSLITKLPEIANITETRLNVVSAEKCRQLAVRGKGYTDFYLGTRIVTVGRLAAEKGQDMIPKVAEILKNRGIDFKWYLVGDGKLRTKIEQGCEETDTTDYVHFLGTQINPYQYMLDADIYVQTSVHEGYCITLAEAKAFGLPIVSTDCAGAHEQLDGIDNCIVIERTVEKMADAIIAIIERRGKY